MGKPGISSRRECWKASPEVRLGAEKEILVVVAVLHPFLRGSRVLANAAQLGKKSRVLASLNKLEDAAQIVEKSAVPATGQ